MNNFTQCKCLCFYSVFSSYFSCNCCHLFFPIVEIISFRLTRTSCNPNCEMNKSQASPRHALPRRARPWVFLFLKFRRVTKFQICQISVASRPFHKVYRLIQRSLKQHSNQPQSLHMLQLVLVPIYKKLGAFS